MGFKLRIVSLREMIENEKVEEVRRWEVGLRMAVGGGSLEVIYWL